jgi:hypothetical protein
VHALVSFPWLLPLGSICLQLLEDGPEEFQGMKTCFEVELHGINRKACRFCLGESRGNNWTWECSQNHLSLVQYMIPISFSMSTCVTRTKRRSKHGIQTGKHKHIHTASNNNSTEATQSPAVHRKPQSACWPYNQP